MSSHNHGARVLNGQGGATFRRLAPVLLIVAAIVAAFALGLDDYLSVEALRDNRSALTHFVEQNAVLAVFAFVGLYALSTALSLPGGVVLSVSGGFLFGAFLGSLWVVIAATLGAIAVFLAARTALADGLRTKAGPWLAKLESGFQEDALSYLLVLRLVPIFPFFVVNLVPAFLGVSLRIFTIGTAVGIIPGAFVFASVGAGLGSVFETEGEFSAASALTPEIITALVGLSLLSLIPVVYKRLKARREAT